jgi:tetratricopeptide (TPR) repeat protein
MSFWDRLFGGRSESQQNRQRLDYLNEALVLERQGDFDAAVTSYRLALRERPNDLKILQNMAIALTKIGRVEEAVRAYRKALEIDPSLGGSHYGLAFLLIKRGDATGCDQAPVGLPRASARRTRRGALGGARAGHARSTARSRRDRASSRGVTWGPSSRS